jgi:hypothetical protein
MKNRRLDKVMGLELSRNEREFIIKSLYEEKIPLNINGITWDLHGILTSYNDMDLEIEVYGGDLETAKPGDEVNVFYSFQNNNLTFVTKVEKKKGKFIVLKQPDDIFKNSHRGYIRVKVNEKMNIYFFVGSKKYELNFPRVKAYVTDEKPGYTDNFDTSSISELIHSFQKKMQDSVSEHKIVMLKDRLPESYEEKLLLHICKMLWIPSTSKEIPIAQPFIEDSVIIKQDIDQFEIDMKTAPFNIEGKIKDFVFQKKLKGIYSELYCPMFYRDYFVGYIHILNKENLKKEIGEDLVAYVDQFAKVLSYSLAENGYFKAQTDFLNTKYEAPIIDLSASGLLFSHNSNDLDRELIVFKELMINLEINTTRLTIDSWIIRKFKDATRTYYGLQFRKIEQMDFCSLYEFLYKKPFVPQGKYMW